MDGAGALGHLCKWLGEEASLQLVVLTGLEKVLAEKQVFQVEDLVLLRDEGMLETVFTKYVTRRKVEIALDRHKLQVSGQAAGKKRARSGWAAGEQERSPAAGGDEAETTPPRVPPQLPAVAEQQDAKVVEEEVVTLVLAGETGGVRSRARLASSTPSELAVIAVTEPMVARAAAEVATQREVVALIEATQHRAVLNWDCDSPSAVASLRGQFASYSHQLSAAQRAVERRAEIEETMRESLALDQLARDRREVVAQRRQAMFDAEQAFENTALDFHAAEASVQLGEAGLQRRLADMPEGEPLALGN